MKLLIIHDPWEVGHQSVLLHRITVMTKERNNGNFGFHCRDCLMCLTCPFCSSRRVPRSLVSSVSKVASRKRKGGLTDQYNNPQAGYIEGDEGKWLEKRIIFHNSQQCSPETLVTTFSKGISNQ